MTVNIVIIIGIIAIIALIALVSIIGLPKPDTQTPPIIKPPVKPPVIKCSTMCFDLWKNYKTEGYDPKFLEMPQVKHVCIEAVGKHNATLGFCSKELGTL